MENRGQLQCKALQRQEKRRQGKNNGKQWKKQCEEQWKQSEIGRLSTSGCSTGRQTAAPRARRCQAERAGWQSLRIRLGGIPTLSFMPLAQTVNARNKEITTQQIREG